ncbi:thiosulfate dehydrogenase [quinone] large subunit [Actinopolymorpha singaporensis]|uniref:Thiosulfate dehydrogenase [quinone] large subunit n=2 Tax=Actinopolymorpha singaporensis TaxID=117157 RepID=A0A1H1VV46_9ACTN|nr:thiosulfate dehydrogenase [quinone] large subunit [Actinopolymorpha singaporensis]
MLVEDTLASRYPEGIAPNHVGWVGEPGWFRVAVLAGLAVVAAAVLLGVCLRGAALVGGALVLGVAGSGGWVVPGLLAVVALMVCAGTAAGEVWGVGRAWANVPVVRRNPWLH